MAKRHSFLADVDAGFAPSFLADIEDEFAPKKPSFIKDIDAEFAPEPPSQPLTQFIRGLTEGVSGIRSETLDPTQAAEKVKTLGITDPAEIERAAAAMSAKARAPVNWGEKAANFTGKMTGELIGFIPAFGAVKVASKAAPAARALSKLGKYGAPAAQSGLAGGLQEAGQVVAREVAEEDQSAGRIVGDVGTSMIAFGAGDYFLRRVLVPAVKAAGGNVGRFVERFAQRRNETRPIFAETKTPPGKTVDTDPAAFSSAVEDAVTASGARIDDVAAAADDIASRPDVQRAAARDADIPNPLPDELREPLKEQLSEEGVTRLSPEAVMLLRQDLLKSQMADDIVKIGDAIKSPFRAHGVGPGTTLPNTAIKIETIADGDEAALVIEELAKVLKPHMKTTLAEVNAKMSNYNIKSFDDMNIPAVLEEAGLRVRVMEAAGRETWKTLARLRTEGAKPEDFARTVRNGVMLLEKVRDARSAAGLLLRTMRPDARVSEKIGVATARKVRRAEEQLLKKIEERITRGKKIEGSVMDERFDEALLALDGNDPAQLIGFLDEFYSPGVWERVSAFRYANMLSSPKTMLINISGNLVQAARASIQRPVAAGLDAAITPLARALGKNVTRDRFFKESTSLMSLGEAMPQAARAVMRKLNSGESTFGQYRYDLPMMTNRRRILSDPYQKAGTRKKLESIEKVLQLPARLSVEAMDEMQKILGYNVNRRALAIRHILKTQQGRNMTNAELNMEVQRILAAKTSPERIAKMADGPEKDFAVLANEIDGAAISETLKNIFQLPNSRTARFFMSLRDDPNKLGHVGTKILQVEFPFLNTPIQLAERGFELFAPYQMSRMMLKAAGRGGLTKYANKGEFVDDLAALTIGLPIAFMTYDLVSRGVITGNRLFFDDAQRSVELQNKKPFSVNAGGMSIEYGRIDPPAFAIGLTANLAEAYMNEKLLVSPWEFVGAVFKTVTSTFKDKLYLKALSDMVEVFSSTNDEDRWARVMSRKIAGYTSQLVPAGALLSSGMRTRQPDRLRADDPVEALSRRYNVGDQSQLYGYYSILGERITDLLEPKDFTAHMVNFLSPFRASEHRHPQVIQELVRLKVSSYTAPLHKKTQGITLSPQEFDSINVALSEKVVPALNALILRDMSEEGTQAIADALPSTGRFRIRAFRNAWKYQGAYDMLPDNRESIPARYSFTEFQESLSKEFVISEIIRGAREQARARVWENQVLPRLQSQGLSPQDIADIRSGRRKEEDFGIGNY